ncbi:MAG: CidA/LrgA family protein [Betaproteobacteria bacterium]|nr:CidA/LrgA family protein [Betaproteobacteria bacterium]
MIPGLVQILLWQGAGELASHFLLPTIPGPVLGLVSLLAFLVVRGRIPDNLALVSDAFSQHLGLLFVPAATGVILFLPQLREHALAVIVALLGSVLLTVAVTALVLKGLNRKATHE